MQPGTATVTGRPASLRWIIVCLLAATNIAAPLAFGATEVWAYCTLQIVAGAAALLWIVSGGRRSPWLWIALAVCVLSVAQVIPLPAPLLARMSPLAAGAQRQAHELTGRPPIACVSIDRAGTFAALRRCLALALVAALVSDLSRSPAIRRALLISVGTAGAAILILGLALGDPPGYKVLGFHDMAGYWKDYKNPLLSGFHSEGTGYADEVTVGPIRYVTPAAVAGSSMGAMINGNHFAACMGLTLPIVVGLLWNVGGRAAFVRWGVRIAAVVYAVAAVYAVVARPAQSRGGLVAIVLSTALTGALAMPRRLRTLTAVLVVVAFVTVGGLAIVFRIDRVDGVADRLEIWSAARQMCAGSPVLGVGLGNFGAAYPAIREGRLMFLAHSAWIECAAEGGAAGIVLVAGFAAWFTVSTLRTWSWKATGAHRMLRLCVVAGVLFAALHGAVDHGIQIPANAWLCATLLGLLGGDIRSEAHSSANLAGAAVILRRRAATLSSFVIAGLIAGFVSIGAAREIYADRLIWPLREALAMQRLPEMKLPRLPKNPTPADRRALQEKIRSLREERQAELQRRPQLLVAPLPQAERATAMLPANASYANYAAQAHLHLSEGRAGPELALALDWFSRSLELAPANVFTQRTIGEIQEQIAKSSPDAQ